MTTMLRRPAAFVGLLLLTTLPAAAELRTKGKAAELEMSYRPGTTYVQTMELEQVTAMPMGGGEQTMNMTMVISMAASKAEAGGIALDLRYERVAIDAATMGMTMSYDSDDDEASADNPLSMMGAMVGQQLRIVLDAEQKVSKIEGLEELMSSMTEGNPMAAQMVSSMFGEEQFSQMIDMGAANLLPGKKVKPGDSWDATFELPMGQLGELSVDAKNTFLGYEECGGEADCAVIESVGAMSMELDDEATGGMAMTFEDSTVTTRAWFDPKLGMARKSVGTTEMTMSMQAPGEDERMTIPMTQTVTVTLETR